MQGTFHRACGRGDVLTVSELLAAGQEVDERDDDGSTGLLWAVANDREQVVRRLLESGADPLLRNHAGDTALHVARKAKNSCIHSILVALSADVPPPVMAGTAESRKPSRKDLNASLLRCVFEDDVEGALDLLKKGANPNMLLDEGERIYLVHVVAAFGNASILQLCLQWGMQLDQVMRNLFTPLLLASLEGRIEVVKVLLDHEVDLKQSNGSGQTALHLAAMGGYARLCKLLVHADLRLLQSVCGFGRNALGYACAYDRPNVIPILKGSRVDVLDCDGRTPLHLAADFASEASVLKVIGLYKAANVGLDPVAKNSNHDSPLHVAARKKRTDVYNVLVKAGGDPQLLDAAGLSAEALIATQSSLLSRGSTSNSSGGPLSFTVKAIPTFEFRGMETGSSIKLEDQFFGILKGGKIKEIEAFLEQHSAPEFRINGRGSDPSRRSALHRCCDIQSTPVLLLLLHCGADVSSKDADGNLSIHEAACKAEKLMKVLINYGCSAVQTNRRFETPLHLAAQRGYVNGVQVLLPHYLKKDLNERNEDGENALMICSRIVDPVPVASLLLQREDLEVNGVEERLSPMIISLESGNLDLLSLFLSDMRFNVNCCNSAGTPLLSCIVMTQCSKNLRLLEQILAREDCLVDEKDTMGNTSLHHGYSLGLDEAVGLLLSRGADPKIRNNDQKTAVQLKPEEKTSLFKKIFQKAPGGDRAASLLDRVRGSGKEKDGGPERESRETVVKELKVLEEDHTEEINSLFEMHKQDNVLVEETVKAPYQPDSVELIVPSRLDIPLTEACRESLGGLEATRRYAPPPKTSLPPLLQTWRKDLEALREAQKSTLHNKYSESLATQLTALEEQTGLVELMIQKSQFDVAELEAVVEKRNTLRSTVQEELEQTISSAKALWELQVKEEDLFVRCGADQREDDVDCDRIEDILVHSTAMQEDLLQERKETNKLLEQVMEQLQREKLAFEKFRVSSEKLTSVNRIIDMRSYLSCVRKEKGNLEQYMEGLLAEKHELNSILELMDESSKVHEDLSETNRIIGRRRLELEEAVRFRDLLESEGSAAKEEEIEEATRRRAAARTSFFELKAKHAELIDRANRLGRQGYPEVWRNIPHVIRGGALLSLDSYNDVTLLKAPNIFVAERGGRKYVLKARKLTDSKAKHSFEKELYILKRLRHPLIVQLETSFQSESMVYLVMPYYEQGTLADWIERNPSENRSRLKSIFLGVVQALCFLHSNGIVHADVKLSNILMDRDKPVLSDFDVSSDSTFFDVTQTQNMAPGTLTYMAPELFEPNARISFFSDMYAFGISIYIAHFGNDVYLAPRAAHVSLPNDRDVHLRNLLESLLARDPFARFSADECLAHEWFRVVSEEQDDRKSTTRLEVFREMLRLTKAGSLKSSFPIRAKINPAPELLLRDSLTLFKQLRNQTRPLKVSFVGEKGSDVGGLTTSLFRRFFEAAVGSDAFFENQGGLSYLPSPGADLDDMFAFGIALSRCLFDERVVELPMSSAFFKFLFEEKVDYSDLEAFDERQATSLKSLLRCPGAEKLGLSFEFCGGGDVEVSDLNKEAFVSAKINYELIGSRIQQLEKIKEGFWSLSCLQKPLSLLGWRECVVLLSGSSFLSAAMILDVLKFEIDRELEKFFRQVVEELSSDDLRLLLYFTTEMPSIPFGGLRNPRGHQPVDKITVRQSKAGSNTLPTSNVCFFQLNLPRYESQAMLREKLLLSIRESGSSFAFR